MNFFIIVDTLFFFRIIMVSETLSCFITWAFNKQLSIFKSLQLNKKWNIKHIKLQNCWLIKTLRLSLYMTHYTFFVKFRRNFLLISPKICHKSKTEKQWSPLAVYKKSWQQPQWVVTRKWLSSLTITYIFLFENFKLLGVIMWI